MTKLTVITINLNNKVGLEKTIRSVFSQNFTDFEYIIIDGGSTDGSVETINYYSNNVKYWVSERDTGIYHAMNKGIEKASGDYLLFLNSGDYLINSIILSKVFNQSPTEDVVYGNIKFENGNLIKSPTSINFQTFVSSFVPHGASFIKKELFNKFGLYNEKNKIVSDWEFFLKVLIKEKCTYKYLDELITVYQENGISANSKFIEIHNNERMLVFTKLFPELVDFINDYNVLANELNYYKNSKVIQVIKQIQNCRLYKLKTKWVLKI